MLTEPSPSSVAAVGDGSAAAVPEAPPPAQKSRTIALIIASALFMEQLDATVLATALPTMARTFQVSPAHMSIALTAYLLSLAVFIPASGKVADRFGARRVFCTAIVVFTLGSALCGVAPSLLFLVVARLLQGLGGAMMVPVGRLVLLRAIPKQELITAMAWFTVPALTGPVLGPPLGGLITTYLSWRWIFYINLPIGLLGLVLVLRRIPEVREPPIGDFDWPGLILSGVSLACLVFGLELISREDASATFTGSLLAVGLVSGILYILYARRHPAPILDIGLMRLKTFSLSVIAGSLTRITGGAVPFLLPLMMQLGFGMSAAQSGAVTFASAAGAVMMKAAATPILRRLGFRRAMIWNALLASAFIAVYAAFRPGWPLWLLYGLLLIGGFFLSFQFTAYNIIAYAEVPRQKMSDATSFYSTFQQLMLSMGICVSAGVLHLSVLITGHAHPQLPDFSAAFLAVTAISLLASPLCALLPPGAGDDMAGRAAAPPPHSGGR